MVKYLRKILSIFVWLLFTPTLFAGVKVVYGDPESAKIAEVKRSEQLGKKIKEAQRQGLLGESYLDINNFPGAFGNANGRTSLVAPQVEFQESVANKWESLGFPGKPKLLNSEDAWQLLKVQNDCIDEVKLFYQQILKVSREFNLSSHNISRLKVQLKYGKCQSDMRKAYLLASIAALDSSSTSPYEKNVFAVNGYKVTQNLPLLLLASYLVNQGQWQFFENDGVERFDGDKPEVFGVYYCGQSQILTNLDEEIYSLGGTAFHELSHFMRDKLNGSEAYVVQQEILEEVIATLTGALPQLEKLDRVGYLRYLHGEESQPREEAMLEYLDAFEQNGPLHTIYKTLFKAPYYHRSAIPGIVDPRFFPVYSSMGGEYLQDFFSYVKEFDHRLIPHLEEITRRIQKTYLSQEAVIDPYKVIERLPVEDTFAAWQFQVGSLFKIRLSNPEDFDLLVNDQTPFLSAVQLQMKANNIWVEYDLNGFLTWLEQEHQSFKVATQNCLDFIESSDPGYLGNQILITPISSESEWSFDGESESGSEEGQPGDKGGKPGDKGGKPGDKGGKPGDKGGKPGDKGGKPGDKGGKPGDKGGKPGDKGGKPGDKGGKPGDKGGKPGDKGGKPITNVLPCVKLKL